MTVSQVLFALELGALIVPITLLSVGLGGLMVLAVVVAATAGNVEMLASLLALSVIASWAALAAAWMLGVAFLRRGRAALLAAPGYLWVGAYLGVALIAGSLFLVLLDLAVPLWLGAPALIPLAHLLYERHLGTS